MDLPEVLSIIKQGEQKFENSQELRTDKHLGPFRPGVPKMFTKEDDVNFEAVYVNFV